jgi:archaellum component FlaC
MKRAISMLAAAAVLFLGGCGEAAMGKDKAQELITQITDAGKNLTAKLEGIKDVDAAKAAKSEVEKLANTFVGLKDKLSNIPAAVQTLLGDTFKGHTQILESVKAAASKLTQNADIKSVLGDALAKLTK